MLNIPLRLSFVYTVYNKSLTLSVENTSLMDQQIDITYIETVHRLKCQNLSLNVRMKFNEFTDLFCIC